MRDKNLIAEMLSGFEQEFADDLTLSDEEITDLIGNEIFLPENQVRLDNESSAVSAGFEQGFGDDLTLDAEEVTDLVGKEIYQSETRHEADDAILLTDLAELADELTLSDQEIIDLTGKEVFSDIETQDILIPPEGDDLTLSDQEVIELAAISCPRADIGPDSDPGLSLNTALMIPPEGDELTLNDQEIIDLTARYSPRSDANPDSDRRYPNISDDIETLIPSEGDDLTLNDQEVIELAGKEYTGIGRIPVPQKEDDLTLNDEEVTDLTGKLSLNGEDILSGIIETGEILMPEELIDPDDIETGAILVSDELTLNDDEVTDIAEKEIRIAETETSDTEQPQSSLIGQTDDLFNDIFADDIQFSDHKADVLSDDIGDEQDIIALIGKEAVISENIDDIIELTDIAQVVPEDEPTFNENPRFADSSDDTFKPDLIRIAASDHRDVFEDEKTINIDPEDDFYEWEEIDEIVELTDIAVDVYENEDTVIQENDIINLTPENEIGNSSPPSRDPKLVPAAGQGSEVKLVPVSDPGVEYQASKIKSQGFGEKPIIFPGYPKEPDNDFSESETGEELDIIEFAEDLMKNTFGGIEHPDEDIPEDLSELLNGNTDAEPEVLSGKSEIGNSSLPPSRDLKFIPASEQGAETNLSLPPSRDPKSEIRSPEPVSGDPDQPSETSHQRSDYDERQEKDLLDLLDVDSDIEMAVENLFDEPGTRNSKPDRTRNSEPDRTRNSEPDRTRDPEHDRTRDPEPDRTRDPEPDRTRDSEPETRDPEPDRTRDPEPEARNPKSETPNPLSLDLYTWETLEQVIKKIVAEKIEHIVIDEERVVTVIEKAITKERNKLIKELSGEVKGEK